MSGRTPKKTEISSAQKVYMPNYIGGHRTKSQSDISRQTPSHSRSRSKSRRENVSNQKDVQIVRDNKGVKRKIEYLDDSPSEEDDLAYSKSVMKSKAHLSKSKYKQGTPNFEN